MSNLQKFCQIVRQRSEENKKSISLLVDNKILGPAISILRQELDSIVRVIYLLSCNEDRKEDLIQKTLDGVKWNITDREMVDLSNEHMGWTKSVYKFGCAFIHLSNFHDYLAENPFSKINSNETTIIKDHLHQYHEFPMEYDLSIQTIEPYLIKIFDKISGNLECYIEDLEKGNNDLF